MLSFRLMYGFYFSNYYFQNTWNKRLTCRWDLPLLTSLWKPSRKVGTTGCQMATAKSVLNVALNSQPSAENITADFAAVFSVQIAANTYLSQIDLFYFTLSIPLFTSFPFSL